jgi:hypothetical protein
MQHAIDDIHGGSLFVHVMSAAFRIMLAIGIGGYGLEQSNS